MQSTFAHDVSAGQRFEFGKNWTRFLRGLNEERMANARQSLQDMLGTDTLNGKTFLDIGSGSGLFSLAARQLGARVHSFDYDPQSVACTKELRERFFKDDPDWIVDKGSALDGKYLISLGKYDIVYSWGVLHHTGAMWQALGNVSELVAGGGLLFIAIYNDQGSWSRRWDTIKRWYNKLPVIMRGPYIFTVMGLRELRSIVGAILRLRITMYFRSWTHYASVSGRGMSRWRDMVDWIGGYPFEVAKPEAIFRYYRDRGFKLLEMSTCAGGIGCNQYVFRKP